CTNFAGIMWEWVSMRIVGLRSYLPLRGLQQRFALLKIKEEDGGGHPPLPPAHGLRPYVPCFSGHQAGLQAPCIRHPEVGIASVRNRLVVLPEQVLAVFVAVGCAHEGVDVVAGG